MGTSRLDIYQGACQICGERSVASLTDNSEIRRQLDQVWTQGGVNICLEEGQWEFAMRAIQIEYDPSIEPDFGLQRAFVKPEDWLATSALCSDEFFQEPLLRYWDETGYWFADLDQIWVRYVSNDPAFGGDLSLWPQSFCEFVYAHFATKIIYRLTTDQQLRSTVFEIRKRTLLKAKSKCAMSEPTHFPARGSWVRARTRGIRRRDGGGTTGNLIG